jgi:hypothetical protein
MSGRATGRLRPLEGMRSALIAGDALISKWSPPPGSNGLPQRADQRWRNSCDDDGCHDSSAPILTIMGKATERSHLAVPELQCRGLFHSDDTEATLRENPRFDRSAVGAWR